MKLTEQQKLEILCAYLPYGIDIKSPSGNIFILGTYSNMKGSGKEQRGIETATSDNYQPILRHRDDMSEGELLCLANNWDIAFGKSILASDTPMYLCHAIDCLQYLHSIHIDTFGAIEAGFAIRKEN
jgi:hypothetical protein